MIVWDKAAESEYVGLVATLKKRMSQADAEREARWAVEIKLHRRATHLAMKMAKKCVSPMQKKQLFAQWVNDFGQESADRLAGYFKNEKLREKILSDWGQ